MRNLTEWKDDFANMSNVQPDEHDRSMEGNYLSGESVAIVSGRPQYKNQDVAGLIPVGLVQNAQINQQKQLNQLFEIGGRDPFFVPGRTQVRARLSRILFDGPSLFYALYQRSSGPGEESDGTETVPSATSFGSTAKSARSNPTMPYGGGNATEDGDELIIHQPGDDAQQESDPGLFWSNLSSAIFNRPLGLGFVLFDMDGQPYGGTYLEKCYLNSHSFGISANATVLAENVNITAARARPLNVSTLPG